MRDVGLRGQACEAFSSISASSPWPSSAEEHTALLSVSVVRMLFDLSLTIDGHDRAGADDANGGDGAHAGDDALLETWLRGEQEAADQDQCADDDEDRRAAALSIHSMIRENE